MASTDSPERTTLQRPQEVDLQSLDPRERGLVSALQTVTDGVIELLRTHIDLARVEMTAEAKSSAGQALQAGFGAGLAALGGIFLSAFVIMLVGVIFAAIMGPLAGAVAATVTAGVFGLLYALVGYRLWVRSMGGLRAKRSLLTETKTEIKRSAEWAKKIKETDH